MSGGPGRPEPPSVVVAVLPGAPDGVGRQVCAGCEEQGVPFAVEVGPAEHDGVVTAARAAALRSRLEVGVAIGPEGDVVVHHAMTPGPVVVLPAGASPAHRRRAGGDAARIVTGLPLLAI